MVIMHACLTLTNVKNPGLAFGVLEVVDTKRVPRTNRGYAGFAGPVYSVGLTDDFTIDQHAKVVYEQLRAGATIRHAVSEANRLFSPRSGPAVRLRMLHELTSDPHATLFGVYLGGSESGKGAETWYAVFL